MGQPREGGGGVPPTPPKGTACPVWSLVHSLLPRDPFFSIKPNRSAFPFHSSLPSQQEQSEAHRCCGCGSRSVSALLMLGVSGGPVCHGAVCHHLVAMNLLIVKPYGNEMKWNPHQKEIEHSSKGNGTLIKKEHSSKGNGTLIKRNTYQKGKMKWNPHQKEILHSSKRNGTHSSKGNGTRNK